MRQDDIDTVRLHAIKRAATHQRARNMGDPSFETYEYISIATLCGADLDDLCAALGVNPEHARVELGGFKGEAHANGH